MDDMPSKAELIPDAIALQQAANSGDWDATIKRLFGNENGKIVCTQQLTDHLEALPLKTRLLSLSALAWYVRRAKQMPPRSWLRRAAKLIDADYKRFGREHPNNPITCRVGCNHCCHIEVRVSAPEAAALALAVVKGTARVDRAQLEVEPGVSRESRRCAFLIDGKCAAYEVRPLACRNHHSVSEPALCDPDRGGETTVYAFGQIAGTVVSATWVAFEHGTLPVMVKAALAKL